MKSKVGTWRELRTVLFLTLDTLFWSRKTVLVAAVSCCVVSLALIARLGLDHRWIQSAATADRLFGVLVSTVMVHFLVVLVALFYGTALVSDEVEGKTLTYLFTRPIPKPIIMIGKYVALLWIGTMLMMPTIILSYMILYLRVDLSAFFENTKMLALDLWVLSLALLSYGAFFSFLGAWLKHSVLAGLVYAFGWEGIVSYLPGFTRRLTITHYIQSILPYDDRATGIAMVIGDKSGVWESVVTLLLVSLLFLGAACFMFSKKEFVLKQ